VCCDDDVQQGRATNRFLSRQQAQQLELLSDPDNNPESFVRNPPANFDGDSGERLTNLCQLLDDFVRQSIYERAVAVAQAAAIPLGIIQVFQPIFGAIFGEDLQGLTLSALQGMLNDEDAIRDVVCCMKDRLEGLPVSDENWFTALDVCSGSLTGNGQQIAGIVAQDLTVENYRAFVSELSRQQPGDSGCPCGCTSDPSVFIGSMVDHGDGSYTFTSEDYTSGHAVLYGSPERIGWPTVRYTIPGCCEIIGRTLDVPGSGGSLLGYYIDCLGGGHGDTPGEYAPPPGTMYQMGLAFRAHEDSEQFEFTIILAGD